MYHDCEDLCIFCSRLQLWCCSLLFSSTLFLNSALLAAPLPPLNTSPFHNHIFNLTPLLRHLGTSCPLIPPHCLSYSPPHNSKLISASSPPLFDSLTQLLLYIYVDPWAAVRPLSSHFVVSVS
jgi:hypothetical protein